MLTIEEVRNRLLGTLYLERRRVLDELAECDLPTNLKYNGWSYDVIGYPVDITEPTETTHGCVTYWVRNVESDEIITGQLWAFGVEAVEEGKAMLAKATEDDLDYIQAVRTHYGKRI